MVSTRPRMNAAQLHRRRVNNNEDNAFVVKTGRQIIVSIIIASLVFAISKVQTPVCANITNSIKDILVYTVDYKKAAVEIYSQIKEAAHLFNRQEQNIPQAGDNINTDENQSNNEENVYDNID